MTNYNSQFTPKTDTGLRLGDIRAVTDAIINNNGASTAYGISALGISQATATQLTAAINEIDSSSISGGVCLPPSTGRISTPYKVCTITNNTNNQILVYPSRGTADLIGRVSSAPQAANTTVTYISSKNGAWFSSASANSVVSTINGGLGAQNGGPLSLLAKINTLPSPAPVASSTGTTTTYTLLDGSTCTITYATSTSISGAQSFFAIPLGSSADYTPSTFFGYYGVAASGLTPRGNNNPNYNVLMNIKNTVAQSGQPDFDTCWRYVGINTDIKLFDGTSPEIWIDEQPLGSFQPAQNSGTAQAGGANTITLASGASATNGAYNQCYVKIITNTGAGGIGFITAYDGTTKIATVSANWATPPDATSTYVVTAAAHGIAVAALSGGSHVLNLTFSGPPKSRTIRTRGQYFMGVNIGPNDTICQGPPIDGIPIITVGDSFVANAGVPNPNLYISGSLAKAIGGQLCNNGAGGTGWYAGQNGNGSPNFMDQIGPPAESWNLGGINTATGTYTLSITYNGSTQTTSALAAAATNSTVATALNGLSNVPASNAIVFNGEQGPRPLRIILRNMPGAILTFNSAGLTPVFIALSQTPYLGTVKPNIPIDGQGNMLPFILYVQGSGNDYNATGSVASLVQTNATIAAQYIALNFPTAITIFTGVVSVATHSGGGVIDATDIAFNAAIRTAATFLPPIGNTVPYIETFPAGIGGNAWIFGSGTVAAPTTNKNDILVSFLQSGHATGNGNDFLVSNLITPIKLLFGAP